VPILSVIEQKLIGIQQSPEQIVQRFPDVPTIRQPILDRLDFTGRWLTAKAAFVQIADDQQGILQFLKQSFHNAPT
jgi:hypothetical protein